MIPGCKQCVNTYCLHSQSNEQLFCEVCGSSFIVGDYLLVNRLLGSDNPFSSSRMHTFEATSLETNEQVILRVVHSDDPLYVQPLQNTAIALSQIHSAASHPGLMRLYDDRYYFTWQIRQNEPAAHFLVAQMISGVTLRDWLEQNGPASEEIVIEWVKQLLDAVDALHRLGFIHRDIKPDNIMVTKEQRLVLIDFDAICRLTNDFVKIPSMGTPAYMAPEQAKGSPRPASDFFSIGKTAIEMLTGKASFEVERDTSKKVSWKKAIPYIALPLAELVDRLASDNTMRRPADVEEAYEFLSEAEALIAHKQRWRWLGTPLVKAAVTIFAVSIPIAAIGSYALSQMQTGVPTVVEAEELVEEGNQLIIQGEERRGLALIERAVQLAPDSADIRAKLATAQAFFRDFNSAVENYNIALEIEPDNPNILHGIADVYEEVDLQESILYYRQAAAAANEAEAPILPLTLNNLARVYLLTDQLQEASEVLAQINTDIEEPILKMAVFKNLGWLNYEEGNYEVARNRLNQALEADATFADPYCLLALIQQQFGEDNYNDRATCLYLNSPAKPEVVAWREELIEAAEQNEQN